MGGLGPGIGGFEVLVVALVALVIVGPRDLPVLLRKVGQWIAKARQMANEFRASFDEMARQSELDELRKEVEALRSGQGMHRLGADAEAAFRDIKSDLERPLELTGPEPVPAPDEFPDSMSHASELPSPAKPARKAAQRSKAAPKSASKSASTRKTTARKAPVKRKTKVDL